MDGEPVEDPDRLVLLVVEVELHHLGVHVGRVPARTKSSPHQKHQKQKQGEAPQRQLAINLALSSSGFAS